MKQEVSTKMNNDRLTASFRQKSAGVSLFTIFLIGMYYAANLISLLPSSQPVPDGALSVVITTVVLIVVVESALQIVLFIGAGKIEHRTERDREIETQASWNAYIVLSAGVFATLASMFASFTPFEMGSTLLLAFLLAEIVKFSSQLTYYRRSQSDSN